MKLHEIIEELRKELNLYKQTETFVASNYSKDIVAAIEIAMLLVEFADRNKSKIRKEDKFWFKGAYQVTREFEEKECRNIGVLYVDLVKIAETNYF